MHEDIPELRIESMDDVSPLLLLEQDGGGNVDRIAIHPVHVRYLAERMGLAEASDIEAHRTIARLSRRMQLLKERVVHLAAGLAASSAGYDYAQATADLAREFCAELPPHLDAESLGRRECTP